MERLTRHPLMKELPVFLIVFALAATVQVAIDRFLVHYWFLTHPAQVVPGKPEGAATTVDHYWFLIAKLRPAALIMAGYVISVWMRYVIKPLKNIL